MILNIDLAAFVACSKKLLRSIAVAVAVAVATAVIE